MSQKNNNQSRMTIYHLIGLPELQEAIRDKYSDFECEKVDIGGRCSYLYYGATPSREVRWGELVGRLSGQSVNLTSSSPGAVLIIPEQNDAILTNASPVDVRGEYPTESLVRLDSRESCPDLVFNAWAITFGVGYQLLDQRYIDIGFGKRVAIRCVDPERLSSITKVTLDDRSKTVRSSIPSGTTLHGFGFEEIGELATRLVAQGNIDHIGFGDTKITVRGADALSIPLSSTPESIIQDLDKVNAVLSKNPASEELALLEKITRISSKRKDEIDRLDERLLEAILDPQMSKLALAWPHEAVDEIGEVQAFQLYGAQKRGRKALAPRDGFPTLEDLVLPIREEVEGQRRQRLKAMSVMLLENTEGDPKSRKIPAKNWLSFETDLHDRKYFLHSGCWYTIEDDYSEVIQKRVKSIFERQSPVQGMPWLKEHSDELSYNQELAKLNDGVCLDRSLISSGSGKSRFEACDILMQGGVFVHVKRTDRSTSASHLIAQALVSAEILTYDEDAQQALKEKIIASGSDPSDYECVPKEVVLVMVKNSTPLTAESLYTFTQVNLSRHDRTLASRGVNVSVVPVVREGLEGCC